MATDHLKSPSPGTTATKIHRPRPRRVASCTPPWHCWPPMRRLRRRRSWAHAPGSEVQHGGRKWGTKMGGSQVDSWAGQSLVILGILGIKMGEMLQIFMIHVRLFICFLGGWNGMNCLGVQKIWCADWILLMCFCFLSGFTWNDIMICLMDPCGFVLYQRFFMDYLGVHPGNYAWLPMWYPLDG